MLSCSPRKLHTSDSGEFVYQSYELIEKSLVVVFGKLVLVLMIIIFWEMTPCGVISQKMIIIIGTAVETSNLILSLLRLLHKLL
jgi:hypothetical protein